MVQPTPTDTICDPSAGTMGFLVACIEYLREHHWGEFLKDEFRQHFNGRNNQPITAAELEQLEALLFDGDGLGTKADFIMATGSQQPLGQFIRSILGLERGAALEAFSSFLRQGHLSADQQQFIEIIINHFEVNGVLDPKQLYEPPYTDLSMEGLDGLFNDADSSNIVSIIREVNGRAMVG